MARKKNYKNPFIMWGSWIGLLLVSFVLYRIEFVMDIVNKISGSFISNLNNIAMANSIILIIIGFLSGWGIEMLLRKNKIIK